MTAQEIGGKIRMLRGDLSLRAFGNKCDVSHTTIDNLEKGYDFRTGKPVQVKMATLEKIASACHISVSYFFNKETSKMLKIKELKSIKGISTELLAHCLGVSFDDMLQIEDGKIQLDYDKLLKVADVLNVTLDNIFGRIVFPQNWKVRNRVKSVIKLIPVLSCDDWANELDVPVEVFKSWCENKTEIDKNNAQKIADKIKIDVNYILGADYVLTIPQEQWSAPMNEEWKNGNYNEALAFILGKGVCVDFKQNIPLVLTDEREKNLINRFREVDEDARSDMYSQIKNIYKEYQSNSASSKNTNLVG